MIRITIAQLNPIIGDFPGNLAKIEDTIYTAQNHGSDLVVFSELFLTGYPPYGLLDKPWFVKQTKEALEAVTMISQAHPQIGILLGLPLPGNKPDKGLYNSAVLLYQGKIWGSSHKTLLSYYDEFNEARYFDPAQVIEPVRFGNELLGIIIGQDAWDDPGNSSIDPIAQLAQKGATLFINIGASPYYLGKDEKQFQLISSHAKRLRIPFIYVNQVGGNDELVFDGRSMYMNAKGDPVFVADPFVEQVKTVTVPEQGSCKVFKPQDPVESVRAALVLGIRDYFRKCGFSRALVGLSGGIDSAVTCCLAVEAIGAANVLGITLPSIYSSSGSVSDSQALAENLGIDFKIIPIEPTLRSFQQSLNVFWDTSQLGIAEQNLQARIRGDILMSFSNQFGYILLSTSNKSEIATGYSTLYGDMCGGLAVLADVPKTLVYELAHLINRQKQVIPYDTIVKPPSAELKPNQLDQDDLPPYKILDQILNLYLEEGCSIEEIVGHGFDRKTVEWLVRAMIRSEYKRRQAAPGIKITTKTFGLGSKIPIAAKLEP
ncbi:MAG: NAD+ synthase [Syntrophomonadaceae bacterium]